MLTKVVAMNIENNIFCDLTQLKKEFHTQESFPFQLKNLFYSVEYSLIVYGYVMF